MLPLGVAPGVGEFVGLRPMDAAQIGEEEQPVVRRRGEEVRDDILTAQLAPRTPLPPRRCERYW